MKDQKSSRSSREAKGERQVPHRQASVPAEPRAKPQQKPPPKENRRTQSVEDMSLDKVSLVPMALAGIVLSLDAASDKRPDTPKPKPAEK